MIKDPRFGDVTAKSDDTKKIESMSLSTLIDLDEIEELPQLSAVIERRISAEADMLIQPDEAGCASPNQVSFLEETVCELVDLVSELETEVVERRRLKRIPR